MLVGFVFFPIGLCLAILGFRGRLQNRHPHCRGCGFDLHGIELGNEARCPECGRHVAVGSSSVRIGKRRRRYVVTGIGAILALIGTAGFSYPLWSQIPAWKNINWYDHLPESVLVSLAIDGNTKAMDTLHARLIPGEVSDEALDSIIEHAIEILDGESVAWDERWGDALIYGVLENKLTSDQLDQYLRSTHQIVLKAHDQAGSNESKMYFHVGTGSTGLGAFDPLFLSKWRNASNGISSAGNKLELRLNDHQFPVAINGEEVVREPRTGLSGSSGFSTQHGVWSTWHLNEDFPLTEDELEIRIVMEFELESDGRILHKWEEERRHTFTRLDHPIDRTFPAEDPERLIESLSIKSVSIPVNLNEGYKHKQTQYFGYSAFSISLEGEHEISLVGEFCLQLGTERLNAFHSPTAMTPRENGMVKGGRSQFYKNGGLHFFEQHRLFLMEAVLNGKVDVVFVPKPEACSKYPEVTAYLATPIIFRDVPIKRLHPQYGRAGDSDGNTWMEWGWETVESTQRFEPVNAERVEEADL